MPKKIIEPCCCCLNDIWDHTQYKLLDVCKVCGMARAKDLPTEKELAKYYQKDYFFGDEYVDYIKDRAALEINFSKRVRRLLYLSNKKKDLNVCEIGSAYGFFLNLVKPYTKRAVGYEMGADGVEFANKSFGVMTFNEDFLDARIKQDQDIVVMWDVIEHLRYPEKYVEKSAKLLKKGGVFALTTGDIGAFLPQRKKDSWRMIHPPTHLFYFTKKSLEILLERNGLSPILSTYDSHYRNVGSVAGMIRLDQERKGRSTKPAQALEVIVNKTGLHKINFGINTRDIVFIAARKK